MKTIYILALLALNAIVNSVNANNILASDINYKHISENKYLITIRIYRHCRQDSFNLNKGELYWFAKDLDSTTGSGQIPNSQLVRTSIKDVTPVCRKSAAPCSPANQNSTGNGYEEHTLEYVLDLTQSPYSALGLGVRNCEIELAYHAGNRYSGFTTLQSGQAFWTSMSLNICNLNDCNNTATSGPEFPVNPVQEICYNQTFQWPDMMEDRADRDQVYCSVVAPIINRMDSSVIFNPGFSARLPITCFDGVYGFKPEDRGAMKFIPTDSLEKSAMSLLTSEYRISKNKQLLLIATKRTELAFIVQGCRDNNYPAITTEAVNAYKVCESDKICFNIKSVDKAAIPHQTSPDTVTLTWGGEIKNASFTVINPGEREKTGAFCWQTQPGDAGLHRFSVLAADNHCPRSASVIRYFTVNVVPKTSAKRNYTCLNDSQVLFQATPANYPLTSVKIRLIDSTGFTYYISQQNPDTLPVRANQKVRNLLTINDQGNCPSDFTDTILCNVQTLNIIKTQKTALKVFPNPVARGEILHIHDEGTSYEIYNFQGQLIQKSQSDPENRLKINEHVLPGSYILIIRTAEGSKQGIVMIL
jgi:hypothetical protein